MIASVTPLLAPPARPEGLDDLAELLGELAEASDDSYRFVLGQALDSAAALLEAHARRAAS